MHQHHMQFWHDESNAERVVNFAVRATVATREMGRSQKK
jgi:hypothetical protein